MPNFIKKIIFLCLRPCIIIIAGKGRSSASENILKVLKKQFKVTKIFNNKLPLIKSGKEILILETNSKEPSELEFMRFLLKNSSLAVLVITYFGEVPNDKLSFSGEVEETVIVRELVKIFPSTGYLVLNFDDEVVRVIKNGSLANFLTYGFQVGASFKASDVNITSEETNFKVNYEGGVVPFWLPGPCSKEQIYCALSAAVVGKIKGMNLVEISQILKSSKA